MNILTFELKRSFKNPWFAIVIAAGIVYSILHFIFNAYPYLPIDPSKPLSAFNVWFPMRPNEYFSVSLYLLMPILAAIPYADSYYSDLSSGYISFVTTRAAKKKYLFAKIAAVFISGSTSFAFILIFNFIVVSSFFPVIFPQYTDGTYSIGAQSLWGDMFYQSPFLYIFLYTSLNVIFAGMFAVLALAISVFVSQRFVVPLVPFLLSLFILFLGDWLDKLYFAPFYFLPPGQAAMFIRLDIIGIEFVIAAVVSGILLYLGAFKREAL